MIKYIPQFYQYLFNCIIRNKFLVYYMFDREKFPEFTCIHLKETPLKLNRGDENGKK